MSLLSYLNVQVVSRVMGLQTDPDPNSRNLGTCSLKRQGEIKVAAGINVAQRLTLKQEVSLNYPSRTDIITRFLINGRGNVTEPERWQCEDSA